MDYFEKSFDITYYEKKIEKMKTIYEIYFFI
jgi:hypothetical protein